MSHPILSKIIGFQVGDVVHIKPTADIVTLNRRWGLNWTYNTKLTIIDMYAPDFCKVRARRATLRLYTDVLELQDCNPCQTK